MSLTKRSPAFEQHMQEQQRRDDNSYEEYQDEMYWGHTTERVIREFGSYEAYRKWLADEADKRR